jgi:hypothetical protein
MQAAFSRSRRKVQNDGWRNASAEILHENAAESATLSKS